MPQPRQQGIRATSESYTTACSNSGSLTHGAKPEIEPASSRTLCWVLNLLSHNGNSSFSPQWGLRQNSGSVFLSKSMELMAPAEAAGRPGCLLGCTSGARMEHPLVSVARASKDLQLPGGVYFYEGD